MARPLSKGLKYLNLDVTFFQDRKVRRLQRRCGENAPLLYIALLCTIYAEGYYVKWDDDLALDIADATRMEEGDVQKMIEACLEVGLLSKDMFDAHHILTSHGIQKQYQAICEQSKRKCGIEEYSLLVSSEETPVNSEETPVNSGESAQHIVTYNNLSESILNNSYSSSNPSEVDEEKEKQKILSVFFFKNWAAPEKETERFLAYNNTGGRCWAKMSETEREAALTLWKQEPEQPKRLSPTFLDCWRTIYYCMLSVGAPIDILRLALSDSIRYTENNSKGTIHCPRPVYVFLNQRLLVEKSRMCEDLKAKRGLDSLEYKPCPI